MKTGARERRDKARKELALTMSGFLRTFFRDFRGRRFYFHDYALRQAGDVWAGFGGEQLVRLPSLPQRAG